MSAPCVSVIMAVHNGELYVRDAIDSILQQTLGDFEFIICNDGSTDSTSEILRSYADTRLRVLNNETNVGAGASRNLCLEQVRGTYVAVMDADDIAYSDRLEHQVRYLRQNEKVGACGMYFERFGDAVGTSHLPVASEAIAAALWFNSPVCHPTLMFRRALMRQCGLRYPHYRMAQDYGFIEQMATCAKVVNLAKVGLRYRVRKGESLSHGDRSEHLSWVRKTYTVKLEALLKRNLKIEELKKHEILSLRYRALNFREVVSAVSWGWMLFIKLPSVAMFREICRRTLILVGQGFLKSFDHAKR